VLGFKQERQKLYRRLAEGAFAPYGIATIDCIPENAYVPEALRVNVLPSALSAPDVDDVRRRIEQHCKAPVVINLLDTLEDFCERYSDCKPTRTAESTQGFLKYLTSPDDPFFTPPAYADVAIFEGGMLRARLDFIAPRAEPPILAQVQIVDDQLKKCARDYAGRNRILEAARATLAPHYGPLRKMRIEGYHNGMHWETRTGLNSRLFASFK
jgi:hypothetical protein